MPKIAALLADLAATWTDELAHALEIRTAWSHLGSISVFKHTEVTTLGGIIDRRLIRLEPGESATEALDRWRGSVEGRIVDRMILHANTMLLRRLPPAHTTEPFGPDWLRHFDTRRPIAIFGTAADLIQAVRMFRDTPLGPRIRTSAADCPPGKLIAAAGEGLTATMVCTVTISLSPKGIHVVSVVDKQSRVNARLSRIDGTLAP
jgi:hypothetical protein